MAELAPQAAVVTSPPAWGAAPIVLMAGAGRLPELVADALRRAGRPYRVLAVRGFTERPLRDHADALVDLLDIPTILATLKLWAPSAIVLVGGVARPSPIALLNAAHALRNRDVLKHLAGGDDRLLRSVLGLLEDEGHRVIGVHEIAPELLGTPGQIGRHAPDEVATRSIETGRALLGALAPFDVGQAAVVASERVLAVEGPEGTDRMLERVRATTRKPFGFGAPAPGTVLVKLPKRGQDLRIDLPAIGPRTVAKAAAAGCAGIAIGAGHTLVIDREATVAAADLRGLFLVGLEVTP